MNFNDLKEKFKILPTRVSLVALFASIAIAWFPFMSFYNFFLYKATNKWGASVLQNSQGVLIALLALFGSLLAWRWDVIVKYFVWEKVVKRSWALIFLVFGCLAIKDHDLVWHIVESAVCFLLLEMYLVWNFSKKENKEVLDSPVEKLEDEKLGRKSFIQQIIKIIKLGEYSRIAISGEWGSGKTSCMNMIANEIKKNQPIVRYSPWLYRNKKEAWVGFVNAVDEGIAEYFKIQPGSLSNNWIVKAMVMGLEQILFWNKYGRLFNSLFMARLRGSLEETKEKVERKLKNDFKEKVIIFVDDIDRSEPKVVLEILMLIKEVMDLKSCLFVCGIDWEETKIILKRHHKHIDPEAYLRKIYQLVVPVPKFKTEYSEIFIKSVLVKGASNYVKGRESEILELVPYLGGTPRRVKEYIYEMNALEIVLESRYGADDFNWKAMYLAGWLRFRFDKAVREVIKGNLFEYWDSNINRSAAHNDRRNEFLNKHFSSDKEGKKCFHELMDELMRNKYRVGDEALFDVMRAFTNESDVEYYFRVLDFPETLTLKEYHEWKILSFEELSLKLLCEDESLIRRKEFLDMLIRERDRLLDEARLTSDATSDQHPKILEINVNLELIRKVASEKVVIKSLMNETLYEKWILSLWKPTTFGFNQSWYTTIRQKERKIIFELTDNCIHLASRILNGPLDESAEKFSRIAGQNGLEIIEEIRNKFECQLATKVLNQFEVQDGIRKYQIDRSLRAERRLLFLKGSRLYSEENRKHFEKLCKHSITNRNLILNIIYLFLDDEGTVENRLHNDHFLKDDSLRELFWNCAVKHQMGTAWLGDLLKSRKTILQTFQLSESQFMKIPDWMNGPDYIDIVRLHSLEIPTTATETTGA